MGLKSIRERSIRSWLTIFGIVISIAVILTLLSLSAGVTYAVEEMFDEFGRNRIFVISGGGMQEMMGGSFQNGISKKDIEAIESLPQFRFVVPAVAIQAQKVEYGGTELYLMVQAFPSDNADMVNEEYNMNEYVIEGRPFQEDERGVVVLGYKVAKNTDDFFGKPIALKNSIYVNDRKFRVIGVIKEFGSPDDNSIMIPLEDAEEILDLGGQYTMVDAIVKDGVDIDVAEERLVRLLERRKGEDTFTVMTPDSIIRQFNDMIFLVQGFLLAIASISLIVGAVGIANNMFTSVLEREKEIGIMKSVGATNHDILQIFLIESGLIGFFGGLAGVILGSVLSLIIGEIAAAMGYAMLKILISPINVIGVLAFAFFVGMISGLIPAWSASRKKIIDTLREH